jgi:gamma-glutamylcyclotransferase (GGCT)/AIG2-like uncharacterized protein YtfP
VSARIESIEPLANGTTTICPRGETEALVVSFSPLNAYLFVYGSLRQDAGHGMHHLLAAHDASLVGPATVRGELYTLGEYSGLVPRSDTTDRVRGELYELEAADVERALNALDDYEGLGDESSPPHEYRRELLPVEIGDGRQVKAWAYVLNRSVEGLERIRSGDFVAWRRSRRT